MADPVELKNNTNTELSNIIHDLHQAIFIYEPNGLADTFANSLAKVTDARCLSFIDTLLLMS